MNRWLIVAFAVFAVLTLGVILVPSGLERAFMELRDKSYDEAQASFEERWARGDRSREVANALTELYVRLGDVDRAIDVLFAYNEKMPKDREAMSRLADLFRDTQRRDDYIKTLERLLQGKPDDVSLLRRIEKVYDLAGRTDDRIKTLVKLCLSSEGTPRDHDALGDLLAATGKKLEALEVLYNAFKRWPQQATPDIAQTFAALAVDANRGDLIKTALAPWVENVNDPVSIDAISGTLASKGKSDLALIVITSSGAFKHGTPQTIVLAARTESKLGRAAEAFARVENLRAAGRLPLSGDDIYVETALRLGKRKEALDHVMARGPQNLQPWLQTWVIAQASDMGDAGFLTQMRDRIASATGDTQPFVLGRLALALGDKDKARAYAARAVPLAQDTASRIAVAALLADLGEATPARALIEAAIPDPAALTADDMIQAIPVTVVIKDGGRALAMAEILRTARPGEMTEILYARALTASGRGKEALELLDDLGSKSETAEAAVFEALKATNQVAEMQTRLFDLLDDGAVSKARRTNYVYMLNDTKVIVARGADRIVDGLKDDLDDDTVAGTARLARIELLSKINVAAARPYARDAAEADPDKAGYIYLAMLKRIGAKSDAVAYIANALSDAKSDKTRTDFLYQWLELGITPAAIPHLRERAEDGEKEWFFAYDAALKQLRMQSERVQFLTAYAHRPDLDPKFRRQVAFQVLDAGAKEPAAKLFKELAADAGPKSPDVDQLMFLWGPRPGADGLAWLTARAKNAPVADRAQWLDRLTDAGAPDRAADLAKAFYAAGDRTVSGAYADALATLKRDQDLQLLLRNEIAAKTADPRTTLAVAKAADARSFGSEASVLYERLNMIAPAARSAWYAGERARALTLFQRALTPKRGNALDHFLYGEALRNAKNSDAADEYETALHLTQGKTARDDKRVRALAFARLDRLTEAEEVVAGDALLRADYASALLDDRRMARTGQILSDASRR